jgi:hypothetical protein
MTSPMQETRTPLDSMFWFFFRLKLMVWRVCDALSLPVPIILTPMQTLAHLGPHAYAVLSTLFSPNKLRENATRLVSADNENCPTKEIVTLNKKEKQQKEVC